MPSKDLESRVSALEEQVHDLRNRVGASERDAAAARVLAGGADREVGELGREFRAFRRATIAGLNALREDMTDGFAEMRAGFTEVHAKFETAAAGQQRIVELIEQVIDARDGDAQG